MAPSLNEIVKNEGTQDFGIAYTWPQGDDMVNVFESVLDFYFKTFIQFCSKLKSLLNGI
jgi:hypothetical protein